jgi:ubiquitin carboxyl-terminal hydrolase 14
MAQVTVLWGPKTFKTTCDTTKPVRDFLVELERLTSVPIANQKLTLPRCKIDPNGAWPDGKVKDGARFMLLGTAAPPPVAPPPDSALEAEPEPEEDAPEGSLSRAELSRVCTGLQNFGVTCWLNSVLQTLRLLPRFVDALRAASFRPHPFAAPLARFLIDFNPAGGNFAQIVGAIVASKPEFSARDPETGAPVQQDAFEAWGHVLAELARSGGDGIRDLFKIETLVRENCPANGEKMERIEELYDLGVSINEDVREITQGIDIRTTVNRGTESAPVLWDVERSITRLPVYLVCHMVRFFYKQSEKVSVKILRSVVHPDTIDLIQFLAPPLRAQVAKRREDGDGAAGRYKLKAVLTHRGRTVTSGHYITWVRVKDQWFKFDDTKVSDVEEVEIERLYGSADWHTSSLVVYEQE